jgi:hypothetical protein
MPDHVLAVNASPRADKGITDLVLQTFLAGCRQAGATTETIYLSKLRIEPCKGELSCFFTQRKTCEVFRDDDGNAAIAKYVAADRVVLASPLHVYGISSHLSRFMERCIALGAPELAVNDGVWTHPGLGRPNRPSATVGVCAFPGVHNFVLFREIMTTLQKVFWLAPSGSVLVPMSRDLSFLDPRHPRHTEHRRILSACKKAGEEFMTRGAIDPATEHEISRPTASREALIQAFEGYFSALRTRGAGQAG